MNFETPEGVKLLQTGRYVLMALGVFLLVLIVSGLMQLRYVGAGIAPTNTISVEGTGDAFAVPDIGEFTFSVVSEKTTVAAAQEDATKKINELTDYVKAAGVDEKDIKTVDYSVYPKYDYVQQACTATYCPPSRQVLKGYEVRQTTQVKVRDTEKAGELLAGVGSRGATEVSGLNFTVEDETAVKREARDEAIADAKTKADALAKSLGVSLVRIVAFSENTGGYIPYYEKTLGRGGATDAVAQSAPEISTGQNKVTSNVSVTYEIR